MKTAPVYLSKLINPLQFLPKSNFISSSFTTFIIRLCMCPNPFESTTNIDHHSTQHSLFSIEKDSGLIHCDCQRKPFRFKLLRVTSIYSILRQQMPLNIRHLHPQKTQHNLHSCPIVTHQTYAKDDLFPWYTIHLPIIRCKLNSTHQT